MIPCRICPGRVFASEYAYNQHAKTSKAHFAKFTCTICHQSFPSVFARNGHLAKTHQDLLCRQCNRYYLSQYALQQHYRSDPNHPSCSKCEAAFADKATLAHHVRVAHPPPIFEFTCRPCQLAFEDPVELTKHYKTSGAHPLCLLCDQGLQDLAKFDDHMKTCHPDLFCNICGVGCQSQDQLQAHYASSSGSIHPVCDICQEAFKDLAALNEHVSDLHELSPAESFASFESDSYCIKCDKIFVAVFHLHEHYKQSPFHPTCLPCDEGFLDDVAYNDHLHVVHPTPTPHHVMSMSPAFSPVVSPPRSLRSLITSPRTYKSSPTTPRILSPFPRTSPTCFTSRSSRSTRSNTPSVQASPPHETDYETDAHTTIKQTVRTRASSLIVRHPYLNGSHWQTQGPDPEVAVVSLRPSSAPAPSIPSPMQPAANITVIVTEPPPFITTMSIGDSGSESGRAVRALRLRPELCMPEPPCTMELMTPSVYEPSPVGEESPSSVSDLPTPSSLESYSAELSDPSLSAGTSDEPAPPAMSSLTDTSPLSTLAEGIPEDTKAVVASAEVGVRSASLTSIIATSQLTEPADAIEVHVSDSAEAEFAESSPIMTTVSVRTPDTPIQQLKYEDESRDRLDEPERIVVDSVDSIADTAEDTVDVDSHQKAALTYDSHSTTFECSSSVEAQPKISGASWHCRICMNEPYEPTVTMCGHLFCHRCIAAELSKNFQCPVCRKMMLVRLYVD